MKALPGCAGVVFALVLGGAHAMTDPTAPPPGFEAPAGEARPGAPVLHSVIIAGRTRAAIIDGERVELGGRYRDAEVVSITEDAVVLRERGTTQVLRLYPTIEKKIVRGRGSTGTRSPSRSGQP